MEIKGQLMQILSFCKKNKFYVKYPPIINYWFYLMMNMKNF